MGKIFVTCGAYSSKSVIANAQRCINLYPEVNPEDTKAPAPITCYTRPGKNILGVPGVAGRGRLLYTASNGNLYAVVGANVYFVDSNWQFNQLGAIAASNNPASMADNGQLAGGNIVLVDGTVNGYKIDMTTQIMTAIVDGTGLFVGADVVKYLQTFFLFNWPNTQNWYSSLADQVAFNALDVAAKASYADNIATIGLRQREVWLIGTRTTEPWSLTGGTDFQFEAIPSVFVPYGCVAKYSLVSIDVSLFWLARNDQGQTVVVKSEGYEAKRISNHALETEMQDEYGDVSDAIGGTYQIGGHTFYLLHFITANKTWAYDLATKQWAQQAWTDGDGNLNRDRAVFYANAYDKIVGLDWENGTLYHIDPKTYNDFGGPISFVRGFPHVVNEMEYLTHWSVIVDIQCGTITDQDADPKLSMRYSDDRGQTFSEVVETSLGKAGEYQTSPQFNNLGLARDRVYELFWSADMKTALNGLYVDVEESDSGA